MPWGGIDVYIRLTCISRRYLNPLVAAVFVFGTKPQTEPRITSKYSQDLSVCLSVCLSLCISVSVSLSLSVSVVSQTSGCGLHGTAPSITVLCQLECLMQFAPNPLLDVRVPRCAGLPLPRMPSTLPWTMVFSRLSCLIAWPKNLSFLLVTCSNSITLILSFWSTHSFVLFSLRDTRDSLPLV